MHLPQLYTHLTTHIVPGPRNPSYFLPLLLLPLALLIPRSLLSRWQSIALFLPAITLATADAWRAMRGVDVISVDVLLWAIFLLGLRDPWGQFEVFRGGRWRGYPEGVRERVGWVGRLLVSIRLGGWRIGRASHDRLQARPSPGISRGRFVGQTIVGFVRGFLVLDLTRAYISYDSYFTDATVPIPSPLPFEFLPPQILRSAIVGAQAWAVISQLFYLPCILPVALNAAGLLPDEWSPHTWPPYFGSPKVVLVHGVRGFWSQYWHQSMRYFTAEPGYAIADTLGLKGEGIVRYGIITGVAFGLSGFIHMGLVPPEPLHAVMHVNAIRLQVAMFFWSQPLAILAEVVMGRLVRLAVPTEFWQKGTGLSLRMLANAVFFVAWSAYCLPWMGDAGRQLGYWRVWPVPLSLWKGFRGEGWISWSFTYV